MNKTKTIEQKERILPKYGYDEKVKIKQGFYKGRIGRVISYEQKGKNIFYSVNIKLDEMTRIEFPEEDLRKLIGIEKLF